MPTGTTRRAAATDYLVWVLHLVADPTAVVAECTRALGPEGRLLVVAGHPRTERAEDMIEFNHALDTLRESRPDTADAIVEWAAAAGLAPVAQAPASPPSA